MRIEKWATLSRPAASELEPDKEGAAQVVGSGKAQECFTISPFFSEVEPRKTVVATEWKGGLQREILAPTQPDSGVQSQGSCPYRGRAVEVGPAIQAGPQQT